jgi:hypothetical protein
LFVTASDDEACIGWFLDCGIPLPDARWISIITAFAARAARPAEARPPLGARNFTARQGV